MISLKKYTGRNPFEDHPYLRDIWPEPLKSLSEEACMEHLPLMGQMELGDIFLILNNEEVIGISGYFPFDDQASDLGLRWHGIIPDERNKGYSSAALNLVAKQARIRFPDALHMIELLPLTDHGKTIEGYFDRMGFEAFGEAEYYSWADNGWQPYRILINDLAKDHRPTHSK